MILTVVLTSVIASLLVVLLLRPYARASAPSGALSFTTEQLGGFSWVGLTLSSVAGLYLELLLIRWVSSEIRIFAYFKNFVLIACFLGFGLGCYLSKRTILLAAMLVPLLAITAFITVPFYPIQQLIRFLPGLLGSSSETQIWAVSEHAITSSSLLGLLMASAVTLPLFALIAMVFIPVGQLVAFYLETSPNGIAAYTVNVLGSLAGIVLYTALCFADQPPVVWFAVLAVLVTAMFWHLRIPRVAAAIAIVACCALIFAGDRGPGKTYWSPYQKLTLTPVVERGEVIRQVLATNGSWYQQVLDLRPEFAARHPELFQRIPLALSSYNLPYRFAPRPLHSVLILGAGMGNDVAAALRNGAEHVTAVEIDPLILQLGKKYHPEHPYDSPRVKVVIADARNYIQNAHDHFDLVVFSLLDSHTTSSHFSNIRIDNYVYTREAMAAASRLLAPGGTFIVKYQVERPWIAGRLNGLMTDVFGRQPFQFQAPGGIYGTPGRFLVVCPQERAYATLADPEFRRLLMESRRIVMEEVPVTTDDWPYFYQRDRGLPVAVVAISLLLLVACLAGARSIGLHSASIRSEFFFLGAGFLLLEAQIISRMALLFGTTWIVNSIVIGVLLLLIVAANGVAALAPKLPYEVGYAGVIVMIVAAYAVPTQALLFESFVVRATVATLFLCLPAFFAGIVFVKRFAASGFSSDAIGSNLLGSLAGGILESLSLWSGLKSLLIVAALLYVAAWVSSREAAHKVLQPSS
ncbi:MAG TPA: methyltransferase domain-containing protein [Thermoanaerobaculia bacterium]|jgi:SAM-dependent methyltransferase|nr:methyltransferase domain-containing protein [Thermoanaerobaculia bacterium]